ncbi:TPA: hypothetical protein HA278_07875 [Candidatus Woesearchaeota archaeon]|nr:hypothetical protein [Candidatus Woesearchaeota archaeon]
MKEVPQSLRSMFLIHFIIDMVFAIPLFIAPTWFLGLVGFTIIDPVTARLVAAALFGIGGASYFTYRKGKESYNILLTLKILWSGTAIVGLVLSIIQGAPSITWLFVALFAVFLGIWVWYKRLLSI